MMYIYVCIYIERDQLHIDQLSFYKKLYESENVLIFLRVQISVTVIGTLGTLFFPSFQLEN